MPTTADNIHEFTVSELSAALKRVVEDSFGHVRVRGEISGFKRAASGHVYLTLKDEQATLDGVMWRGTVSALRFAPEDGLEVVCTGRLTTYPGRSKYQIVIEQMAPAGAGALMALLEARKRKLAAEGLFDDDRKRALPFLPNVIGVVTSPTGAVIRDILHRLQDRFPRHVLVWPVLVQGERAAAEISAAIAGFNALARGGAAARPDLLIVARGGGSIEDLWAFNEEVVVRAAAASQIPLISAVGHETDTTLIDLAADRRAPTPTAAAEIAVPVRAELLARVLDQGGRLINAESRLIEAFRTRLVAAARALPRPGDLLALARQRFDGAADRLASALRENLRQHEVRLVGAAARLQPATLKAEIARKQERLAELGSRQDRAVLRIVTALHQGLEGLSKLLASVSHAAVLARGFALVHRVGGGLVRRRAEVTPGLVAAVEFTDGRIDAIFGQGGKAARDEPEGPVRQTRRRPKKRGQGELF